MSVYRYLSALVLAGLIAVVSSSTSYADTSELRWRIDNDLRLFRTRQAQESYLDVVASLDGNDEAVIIKKLIRHHYPMNGTEASDPLHRGDYLRNTFYDPSRHQYDPSWAQNPAFTIRVWLPPEAGKGRTCRFANLPDVIYQGPQERPCPTNVDDGITFTTHNTDLIFSVMLDGAPTMVARIQPVDHLVAVIGDSYASGEGNPDVPQANAVALSKTLSAEAIRAYSLNRLSGLFGGHIPPRWWDERCHRSLFSGSALAVARLALRSRENGDQHQSFTYINLACSGASVYDGILTGYIGRETFSQVAEESKAVSNLQSEALDTNVWPNPLPAQLDNLGVTLCSAWDENTHSCPVSTFGRKPDALIVTTGGNDVGFGGYVRMLLKPSYHGEFGQLIADARDASIDGLDDIYRHLYARLVHSNIVGSKVIIAEYPDILSADTKGGTCSDNSFKNSFNGNRAVPGYAVLAGYTGIDQDKAQEAREAVYEKLNAQLFKTTTSFGWVTIGTPTERDGKKSTSFIDFTQGHGYCTPLPWFRRFDDTVGVQGEIPDLRVVSSDVQGLVDDNTYGSDVDAANAVSTLIARQAIVGIIARWDEAQWRLAQECQPKTHNGTQYVKGCFGVSTHFGGIPSGLFHPNYLGHWNLATYLADQLDTTLKVIHR